MSSLFPAGGNIRVKRSSDAVTPAMIEMLMVMLTMMFITISKRIYYLYIVYCIVYHPPSPFRAKSSPQLW